MILLLFNNEGTKGTEVTTVNYLWMKSIVLYENCWDLENIYSSGLLI